MNRNIFAMSVVTAWVAAGPFASAGFGQEGKLSAAEEITQVMRAQQDAWNRGDIDAFMNGYAKLDSIVFVSGDDVTRGWQTVRDRYKTKYSDRAKMGKLTFSEVETPLLGPDSAVVLGRWKLDRKEDQPHGRFTLVFRRTTDGWQIVYDHTSAATPSG